RSSGGIGGGKSPTVSTSGRSESRFTSAAANMARAQATERFDSSMRLGDFVLIWIRQIPIGIWTDVMRPCRQDLHAICTKQQLRHPGPRYCIDGSADTVAPVRQKWARSACLAGQHDQLADL